MARLNWHKANLEKKMAVQGVEPTDDLLPQPSTNSNELRKRKSTQTVKKRQSNRKTLKNSTKSSKKSPRVDGGRLDLLHFVANSVVAEKWTSNKVPKSVSPDLAKIVSASGGLLAWAKAQKEFDELVERKKKKKEKKGRAKTTRQLHEQKDSRQNTNRNLERIRHLRSEIQQAEEFIRLAKKEISKLEADST